LRTYGDPRIYIETIEKMFDRFEQLKECITAGDYVLGRLVHSDVTNLPTSDVKMDTYTKEDGEPSVYCFRRLE
jgi:aspartate carbamoyltransferase catalytic subunit